VQRGFRPAGTVRNSNTFRRRAKIAVSEDAFTLMCDAQTSGGLLIAISPDGAPRLEAQFRQGGLFYAKIGRMTGTAGFVSLTA
jgi:selenide, water dikinase